MQNSLKILGGIALIAAVGGCSSSATSSAADSSTVTGTMAGTSAHSTSAHGAAARARRADAGIQAARAPESRAMRAQPR